MTQREWTHHPVRRDQVTVSKGWCLRSRATSKCLQSHYASMQNAASIVIDTRHDRTWRLNQSMTATR